MMKTIFKGAILSVILGMSITSCNPRSYQVWFTELQHAHSIDQNNVVRIYLDKSGYFYPSKTIYIPYKDFYDPHEKGNTYGNSLKSGSLKYYFTGDAVESVQIDSSKRKKYIKRSDDLKKTYELPGNLNLQETFDSSQSIILNSILDSLDSNLSSSNSKTLVIFIHGFNDPNPSPDYQRLRNRIEEVTKTNDFVYLEVYWNGLTANQGNPGKSKIWGPAQYNSCETAVALRQILNGLHKEYNVRIIAHSTGASVITSALFNTTQKWKDIEVFPRYSKMIKETPAPSNLNINLGLLAPAIPGKSTFSDFNKRDGDNEINNSENNIKKIIIGYNCNDFAVTKRIFGKNYLSNKFGSTSLGADYKCEIEKTRRTLVDLNYPEEILVKIPFNQYKCDSTDEEHGVYYFMQNDSIFNSYIETVFLNYVEK